jgi:hypothetical protein
MNLEILIKSYLRVPPPGTGESDEAEDQLYNGPTQDDQDGGSKYGTGQQFYENVGRIFRRGRQPQPQAATHPQPPTDPPEGQDTDQGQRDNHAGPGAGPVSIEGDEGGGKPAE